jgi:hypothetical protein
MMGAQTYDFRTDPILQALVAEADADQDVIGLALTGSRAVVGAVTDESDYDVMFIVTNEAYTRHNQTQTIPVRGATVKHILQNADIWEESPETLQVSQVPAWELPALAEAIVLFDRSGEVERLFEALRRIPEGQAEAMAASAYDGYLNGLYRSLKSWRRGNELGARLEAAQSVDFLVKTLFALERRWQPYGSRLIFHLEQLESQGWQVNELRDHFLDIITTANPRCQQTLARQVSTILRKRGFGHVYDEWNGEIDQILAWEF